MARWLQLSDRYVNLDAVLEVRMRSEAPNSFTIVSAAGYEYPYPVHGDDARILRDAIERDVISQMPDSDK